MCICHQINKLRPISRRGAEKKRNDQFGVYGALECVVGRLDMEGGDGQVMADLLAHHTETQVLPQTAR